MAQTKAKFDLQDRRPAAWAVSDQPVRRCDLAAHDRAPLNTWPTNAVQTPFGGWKNSGYGREKGIESLNHYSQIKCVTIKLDRPARRARRPHRRHGGLTEQGTLAEQWWAPARCDQLVPPHCAESQYACA